MPHAKSGYPPGPDSYRGPRSAAKQHIPWEKRVLTGGILERRVKCSLETPRCRNCIRSNHQCHYGLKLTWREEALAQGICFGRQGTTSHACILFRVLYFCLTLCPPTPIAQLRLRVLILETRCLWPAIKGTRPQAHTGAALL